MKKCTIFNFGLNERDLGSTSWAGSVLLGYSVGGFPDGPVAALANTIDLRTHILYFDIVDLVYRFYEESEGWSDSDVFYNEYILDYDISSSSNDLYVIFNDPGTGYIKYRQYDAAPLAPQNLAVTKSGNNHPLLTWTANTEPDVSGYNIYKKVTSEMGFEYLATTSSASYEDPNETYPVPGGPGYTHPIWYYVKAVDIGSHES